jgi:hypothetical protein
MKSLVYKQKMDNRDALLHWVLHAAEWIQNTLDSLERTINSPPQWALQCITADGAQFEHLLQI